MLGEILGLGGALLGRQWAKSDASKMRNWTEDMRATAHQVEVEDLKKAGLNPVLSANAGAPMGAASAPRDVDIAGSMQKMAEARNADAIATQNEVAAKMARDKLAFYNKNPQAKDVVQGASIAQDSGLPPWMGGMLDIGTKIWDKLTEQREKSLKRINQKPNKTKTKTTINNFGPSQERGIPQLWGFPQKVE